MPTYPYWDSSNRYIVAGVSAQPTVFAQIYAHPSGYWQLRCYGNRTNCPEKIGPYFGSLSNAESALQIHCQQLHYINPASGPPVAPLPPEILALNPLSGHINTAFTLTLTGQNFTSSSQIYFDGSLVAGTVFISTQQLSCPITATQIPQARSYSVRVTDPLTGTSNFLYFTAVPAAVALALAQTTTPTDPTTPSKIITTHS